MFEKVHEGCAIPPGRNRLDLPTPCNCPGRSVGFSSHQRWRPCPRNKRASITFAGIAIVGLSVSEPQTANTIASTTKRSRCWSCPAAADNYTTMQFGSTMQLGMPLKCLGWRFVKQRAILSRKPVRLSHPAAHEDVRDRPTAGIRAEQAFTDLIEVA